MTVLPIVLLVSGLMACAANLGGQIRHTEIRAGTADTRAAEGAMKGDAERERERGVTASRFSPIVQPFLTKRSGTWRTLRLGS